MKSYLTLLRNLRPDTLKLRAVPLAIASLGISLLMLQSSPLAHAAGSAPVAVDDYYGTLVDSPLMVSSPGILGNDTDPEGDSLVVVSNTTLQPAVPDPGTLNVNANGSFMYIPSSGFTGIVTFTYTAGDGTSSSATDGTVTIEVASQNADPVADAGGPYTASAGSIVTLDAGASTDPDGNPLTYRWNLDDDGFFGGPGDATGVTVNFDTSSLSAPTTWNVSVLVQDPFGAYDIASTTIDVVSFAPSITVFGDTIDEGDDATLQVSFADSTPNDTHVVTIDWGDGTPVEDLGQVTSPLSPTRQFVEDGSYTALVTVTDGDGNVASDTASITVNNVAPVVNAGPDAAVEPGELFSLPPATFTDAGVTDTHTATVYWGDGSNDPGVITESAGSGSVAGSHSYAAAGTYMVTVSVVDDEGDSGVDRLDVVVSDPEPEVTATPAPTATPTPSPTVAPTPAPTATPTPAPEPTATATATPSPEPAQQSTDPEPTPIPTVVEPTATPTTAPSDGDTNTEPHRRHHRRWFFSAPTDDAPSHPFADRVRTSFFHVFFTLIRWCQALFSGLHS